MNKENKIIKDTTSHEKILGQFERLVSPFPSIMEVPLKYRLRLQGKYNAKVCWCVKCNEYFDINKYKDLGFSEQGGYLVLIMECQKCWKVQYHHIKSRNYLETILLEFKLIEEKG